MNVNKKFDRLRQWGKERMGGEVATTTTDEFKALEVEMDLRHQGMERLHASTSTYIKSLSTRTTSDHNKEKLLPVAHFGSTLSSHAEDFEPDSDFGSCLAALGRANERLARIQETYAANATSSWLESVERSLVQMKEYQAARKKLESRRLAYDSAAAKMQRSKKEDWKGEEELRSQKAKYEESCEEVWRRMMDIKEAEAESVADLTGMLEAECAYYERCREVLVQVRREWPAASTTISRSATSSPAPSANGIPPARRATLTRSRASSITDNRFSRITEESDSQLPTRPSPYGSRSVSAQTTPRHELPGFDFNNTSSRPTANLHRSSTTAYGGGIPAREQSQSPAPIPQRLSRVPTEPTQILGARSNLRSTKRGGGGDEQNIFHDDASEVSDLSARDDGRRRSSSWSVADGGSVVSSVSGVSGAGVVGKRAPPPPPPSRSTKPAPPPVPVRRNI